MANFYDNEMEFEDEDHRIASDQNAPSLTDDEIASESNRSPPLQYPSSENSSNLDMSGVSMTSSEKNQIREISQSLQSNIERNEKFKAKVHELQSQLTEKDKYIRELELKASQSQTPKGVRFANPAPNAPPKSNAAIVSASSPVSQDEVLELKSLLDTIKSEVQSRETPVVSEKDTLMPSDILRFRTLALVSSTFPLNPLIDGDFNEMRDVLNLVVQSQSKEYPDGSDVSISRIIRHYGGQLIVCPHEAMMKGLMKLNSAPESSRTFGKNGGIYVIRRYEPSIFSDRISVITNNFGISSANDFVHKLHDELEPANWTQIGTGRFDARDDDSVILEFHVPHTDYVIIQNDMLKNRVYDNEKYYYKFRLAADRFESHDFKFKLKQLLTFAHDLNKKYHPMKGIKACDDERFFRGRQMNRGGQNPRDRSRSRSRY